MIAAVGNRSAVDVLVHLLYRHRVPVSHVTYSFVVLLAFSGAFMLRFEFLPPPEMVHVFKRTVLLLVVVRVATHFLLDVSNSRWRFAGTRDVLRLAAANLLGTVLFYVTTLLVPYFPTVPRSIVLLEWFLSTFAIASVWILYRVAFEQVRHYRSATTLGARRVLIVGAGEAGSLLVREMLRLPTGYRPVAYVDDDPEKQQVMLHGVKVLGRVTDLPAVARAVSAQQVVIAVPSAEPEQLRRIVEVCESTALEFKVLPGVAEVLLGNVRLHQLRDLRIEDLLGREPISLELPELLEDLRGQTVLITGAAGSIGSELARQVALHSPARLLLLDQAETPLFFLERELRALYPAVELLAVVADIVDEAGVHRLFREHRPSRVYHAAAYKHVPMMQVSAREAVRNNVLGTWNVANAAGAHGAQKFVLVSTDKAVRPTSVMGASKRLAEVVVLALKKQYPACCFCAVRFGNVLGSAGSVIPIFRQQIEAGEPLTVTDPEATRYFMTIPEAVQLILQASLLPELQGAVAMLEMGEPVRIVDLARNLLRLSGAPSNGNSIVFTGLRSGEKLHEELWDPEETTGPTSIPKVRIVQPTDLSIADMLECLNDWEKRFQEDGDAGILNALTAIFPDLHARGVDVADLPALQLRSQPTHASVARVAAT